VDFGPLNLLIGANASGKSNVLDALRFLADGLDRSEFEEAVIRRGGIRHLAWKGEQADAIGLEVVVGDGLSSHSWKVEIERQGHSDFRVRESLSAANHDELLFARGGEGWWISGNGPGSKKKKIDLKVGPAGCALAAASADAAFPARGLAEFVRGWRFFDPNPIAMRRASHDDEGLGLDHAGRNLAARLFTLHSNNPAVFRKILEGTRNVIGLPTEINFVGPDAEGRIFFTQAEPDLKFQVHQVGASSGTLRMLAMMAALYGESGAGLVGIEEPENYVHPNAIAAFAEYLKETSKNVQVVATTHSPMLLDAVGLPAVVRVVRRSSQGTEVEKDPESVQEALKQSGLGLGEFHETQGFGA
jgi:predicted ATPase